MALAMATAGTDGQVLERLSMRTSSLAMSRQKFPMSDQMGSIPEAERSYPGSFW